MGLGTIIIPVLQLGNQGTKGLHYLLTITRSMVELDFELMQLFELFLTIKRPHI